jgi:ferric hydroxamate transport system permease protein
VKTMLDGFSLIGRALGRQARAATVTEEFEYLLLRADPWDTPRIYTWLSGTRTGGTGTRWSRSRWR